MHLSSKSYAAIVYILCPAYTKLGSRNSLDTYENFCLTVFFCFGFFVYFFLLYQFIFINFDTLYIVSGAKYFFSSFQ